MVRALIHQGRLVPRGAHRKTWHLGGKPAAHAWVVEIEDLDAFPSEGVVPAVEDVPTGKIREETGFLAADPHVAVAVDAGLHDTGARVAKQRDQPPRANARVHQTVEAANLRCVVARPDFAEGVEIVVGVFPIERLASRVT